MPSAGLEEVMSAFDQRQFDVLLSTNIVESGLDIPNAKTRKTAEGLRPRLMSAMRDAVLSYASLSYVVGERPNADLLKARLQKAVDAVLGKGEATVALASVMVVN
jgi:hypothetical protein